MFPRLYEKGKIGSVEIKNRIFMPAMGAVYGVDEFGRPAGNGYPTEREIAYYEARAKGGVGLIITALTSIASAELGGSNGSMDVTLPNFAESMKPFMDRIHKYDSKIIFQLGHLGRQGRSYYYQGHQPVSPSALKECDDLEMPRELTNAEIKEIINGFVQTAKVLFEGGADGVELHGAHGYLIHQFMSPYANIRTDEYGGSFENRMRFVTEIIEGIKKIKPDHCILAIRINAKDGYENGMTIDDCIEIAKYLESIGVDCIDLSNGTQRNFHITNECSLLPEGVRTEQVKRFKSALNIPVLAVNNIKRPSTAEKMLEDGVCDFIGLGRPSLVDPDFGIKAENNAEDTIRTCIGCNNCHEFRVSKNNFGQACECAFNPYMGREFIFNENTVIKNGIGKNAVIIGGGPGGMTAAEVLSLKGFHVTLLDKDSQLGGALKLASKATGKYKIQWAIDHFATRLEQANVDVRLNSQVNSVDDIKEFSPSVVVVAIGGIPIKPQLPGVDLPNIKLAHDVLKDCSGIENMSIAIVGSGMTGLETADVLLSKGNKISMYDMLDEIAKGAEEQTRYVEMQHLAENGVTFHPNHKAIEFTTDGVVFEDLENNQTKVVNADLIILSLGVKANPLLESFAETYETVISLGDCVNPSKIVDATRSALVKLWNI